MPILSVTYKKPTLLDLPLLYSDLFDNYLQKKFKYYSIISKESAVCLVCGTHMPICCFMEDEYFKHYFKCHKPVLLGIHSTKIYLDKSLSITWGSLYLDEHGEEDIDLK